ncbi:MAG: regulatory protein RecX [Pseudomonadota bacterium]|nr:regulatory protein RecX [Pseudomonadota bacterium]
MEAEQAIREKAIQLLARREYSARELVMKLSSKFDPEQVSQVLATLTEQGLQSDERFASGLVRGRISQGHGPIRIQSELKQKGIDQALIQHIMSEQEVDWFEQALATYQRRFGTDPSTDLKVRAKQMRFLQYRGFSLDQIRYALDFDPEPL